MITDMVYLSNVEKLVRPRSIGGIGQSTSYATHVGEFLGWDSPFNVAYYCPGLGVNLFSLGAFMISITL
jgi:hypothetical protein